ncbi:MAG: HDOD domain-containing protein [Candidatus Sedimenticola sp. PURPLELP]
MNFKQQMEAKKKTKFPVKEFVADIKNDILHDRLTLPTLPDVALEALLIVNDVDSSAEDVARIVSKDTSIAARLVRYANSPIYHGSDPATTVSRAITRIGFDSVKQAIYLVSMRDVFETGIELIRKRMNRLWQHSVRVASKSALLADQFPHLDKETALLAGLIHDVGVIPVLLKAKDYEELHSSEANLEKVISGLHMALGKILLSHWKFEPVLLDVAALHDHLDREPPSDQVDYVDIIQVANILSYTGSGHIYARMDRRKIPAFRRLGLEELMVPGGEAKLIEQTRDLQDKIF